MHVIHRLVRSGVLVLASSIAAAQAPVRAPQIWSDKDLPDWATPIAALQVRPALAATSPGPSVGSGDREDER
jgi:hypothetical protein